MPKSTEAFRTISEVADDLEVPKHVLRFWEMRFPQIKPMKRGGGRRYYRPADVELLKGIRHLLHAEGYTIKGVQKILRDQGPDEVQQCWQEGAPAAVAAKDRGVPARVAEVTASRVAVTRLPQHIVRTSATITERRRAMASIIAELEACRQQLQLSFAPASPRADEARQRKSATATPKPAKSRSGR